MFDGCTSLTAKCNREAFMGNTETYPGYTTDCKDMFKDCNNITNTYISLSTL